MSKFKDNNLKRNPEESHEKSDLALREEEVLNKWKTNHIFEKTLQKDSPKGEFVFYDGPPFATGLPHYGHLLPGTMKDIIPRYKTMQGYHVARRWGWDCHGLPLENQVEKHLALQSKLDIEKFGIDKFNEIAKEFVLQYADDWKETIPRSGRFVDMEDDYRTMDSSYTESIWWAFKTLWDKKLAYEGFKAMHICPRCQTPLSNFEVNQGYTDIKDFAVTVKFKLKEGQTVTNEYNSEEYELPPHTSILAWTTTPWTLPGNMALAVNEDVRYVLAKIDDEYVILAYDKVLYNEEVKEKINIINDFIGKHLIGLEYEPVFPYYIDKEIPNKENVWKVYAGDFVTTEDGTGVVHIAPAFGSDDLALAQKHNIPIIHHVNMDGTFISDVTDFAGMEVKPKSGPGADANEKLDHTATDIEIIKWLAHSGKLFAKEKITHSYPLCWRCDTPLLNYATTSWFIEVTKIKDTLIAENKEIHWVPEQVGQARFGDWLEGARDWAISRLRYWGAPLPVWKSESGQYIEVPGSLEDLKKKTQSSNTYYMMRHAEADQNVTHTMNYDRTKLFNLTEKGKKQAMERAEELKKEGIDLIITSPFPRTRQTAEVVAQALNLPGDSVIEDERLREISVGEFEGKTVEEYHTYLGSLVAGFTKKVKDGETFQDAKNRVGDFIYDIDSTYKNKRILIVSHSGPLWMLKSAVEGLTPEETVALRDESHDFIDHGEVKEFSFAPIPHNPNYELDYHRPYIDEVTWTAPDGTSMHRIPDVFDCWFESGSMPFASNHYPFNKKKFDPEKDKWYPADFIAEGLDQTRGWFYSLIVLGVALFDRAPFKNVIVNGLVLAEDGKKMSKRLKNYPEVDYIFDKYGADALRYYLINSQLVRSEPLNFSEKGVEEVVKKVIRKLENVVSFLEMYSSANIPKTENIEALALGSSHALDQWIISRLNQLTSEVTENLDRYELDRAARPFIDFIDDLSTWYLRRSRDRFKENNEDAQCAQATTRFVMFETLKVLSPFMPFITDALYERLRGTKESIHLESWPEVRKESINTTLIDLMKRTRYMVTLALDLRIKAGIKVRQPLSKLSFKKDAFDLPQNEIGQALINLIRDEVNIKEVVFESNLTEDAALDTYITEDLKREGQIREIIRLIQDMRKKAGLEPSNRIILYIEGSEDVQALVKEFRKDIIAVAGVEEIRYEKQDDMTSSNIQGMELNILLVKN